jgi:Protein of unknown function (DUF2778)
LAENPAQRKNTIPQQVRFQHVSGIEVNMWTYAQKTGQLLQDGKLVSTGYSGCGEGKNNAEMQAVENMGPIPQGQWIIVGRPTNTAEHGPYVLQLQPCAGTDTFGRSGFLMHGDSIEKPGCASRGCVIMPRTVREQVWTSGDVDLEVVAEFATRDLDSDTAASAC